MQVDITWIRHAESVANAVVTRAPFFERWKALFLKDPGLTQKGKAQCAATRPEIENLNVQLVVCSHLRRSVETALRLFPTKNIHSVCGCNELVPIAPNRAESPAYYNTDARLIPSYDAAQCGLLACSDGARFTKNLHALIRRHVDPLTQKISVAVVGHSMWLNLHVRRKFDVLPNTGRFTTTHFIQVKEN